MALGNAAFPSFTRPPMWSPCMWVRRTVWMLSGETWSRLRLVKRFLPSPVSMSIFPSGVWRRMAFIPVV